MDARPEMDGVDGSMPPAASQTLQANVNGAGEYVPRHIFLKLEKEEIPIDLNDLPDIGDILLLIEEDKPQVEGPLQIADEYWVTGKRDLAEQLVKAAIRVYAANPSLILPFLALQASFNVAKARTAPKTIFKEARHKVLEGEPTKKHYHQEATACYNGADRIDPRNVVTQLGKGILHLAMGGADQALKIFEAILKQRPTNILALMGKARILFSRSKFKEALVLYQAALRLLPPPGSSEFISAEWGSRREAPDPRIGIGLCLANMGRLEDARRAWERSRQIFPNSYAAYLLLGLLDLNASKDPSLPRVVQAGHYRAGIENLQRAWKINNANAAAANALGEHFMNKGVWTTAQKLAEHTIQYADTRLALAHGYLSLARTYHRLGDLATAQRLYSTAAAVVSTAPAGPIGALATLGCAQIDIQKGETLSAMNALDDLWTKSRESIAEVGTILASLRARGHAGARKEEAMADREKARVIFDRTSKMLSAMASFEGSVRPDVGPSSDILKLMHEPQSLIEMGRLWHNIDLDRSRDAYLAALDAVRSGAYSSTTASDIAKLLSNIGAVEQLLGQSESARARYEEAMTELAQAAISVATSSETNSHDALVTIITYNLARAYEDVDDAAAAKQAYERLLSSHPEYADAKARLAALALSFNRQNDAHELLKQALTAQSANPNLRAFYSHFLASNNSWAVLKDFCAATLKDVSSHDVYALVAYGWACYNVGRNSRPPPGSGPAGEQSAAKEKSRNYLRAAEFFEKALQYDPKCAVAAQGIAILIAEDAMSIAAAGGGSAAVMAASQDASTRARNARDAITVLGRVRETLTDGSVFINLGHCFYNREEYDRAIENYGLASKRFYNGQNVSVLQYLARTWFARANREHSYPALKTALRFCQQALYLQPQDRGMLFNVALIQQKMLELLFSLPPPKRKLSDMQAVIESAMHSQKLFTTLASDKTATPALGYSAEVADQRRRYGETLLKRSSAEVEKQEKHEVEESARLEAARRKRQEDMDRQEAEKRRKQEEYAAKAEALRKQREEQKKEAMELMKAQQERLQMEEEEERRKKELRGEGKQAKGKGSRRKKVQKEDDEEDALPNDSSEGSEEAAFSSDGGATSSKKRKKLRRVVNTDSEGEGASDGGVTKKPKRRIVRESKKKYKSAETIESSEEE